MPRKKSSYSDLRPTLVPDPVAVDLIRFEKNLLQMGFFGAHDTRHNVKATRRIEQTVNREGQKIKVAAEFRASQDFGLPSTADRDKYIAFMRVAMEQKTKHGQLMNPVRFSGYRLLKELGLSYSGENYEDINRWGQRMADTTITSEQVIYLAARKKYANKTVHVFRSFTRAGQSNLDDTGRTDSYEVVLEDWLLENLNQSYVVPEDFNAYRKLKRPTAKGIFGYLHLWFHASHGRQIEKDYAELCVLLNIPAYRHRSKIRDTMGFSLDELIKVGYLSAWDIRPMVTKEGYKLILLPGDELLHVLAVSQRKQLYEEKSDEVAAADDRSASVVKVLVERGISAQKAAMLARNYDPQTVLEKVEYAEFLIAEDQRQRFDNPAGFIIYTIENSLPVPTSFVSQRKRREREQQAALHVEEQARRVDLEQRYADWVEERLDAALKERFSQDNLEAAVKQLIKQQIRSDERFGRMPSVHQRSIALQMLKRDLNEELALPALEQWKRTTDQMGLFEKQR
jgi:hypothetical protein